MTILNYFFTYFMDPYFCEKVSFTKEKHIFSNILDVAEIDLKHLANLIDSSILNDNYIVSVGPLNATNRN